MKKILVFLLTSVLMGCAALTPSRQMLSVTSNVPDAVILVNGENIGFGSGKTEVKRNSTVNIMAIKDGYHPAIGAILDAAVCGFGLIIFAIPWCVSAFAAPGAWSLDDTDVSVFMIPNTQTATATNTSK